MELLGVEGKEEKEALAILTKFSADHGQVSCLKKKNSERLEEKEHSMNSRQRDLMPVQSRGRIFGEASMSSSVAPLHSRFSS